MTADNKAMHAEHAIGRFLHGGFTRACRVMAVVRQRNQHRPTPATSMPTSVASFRGRSVCVGEQHSAQQLAGTAPESLADLCGKRQRRVKASFAGNVQRETSNARNATDL
jgi:hypothetical protein